MTNPFLIIFSLAAWELFKYVARNLYWLALDGKSTRYWAYRELRAFGSEITGSLEFRRERMAEFILADCEAGTIHLQRV